MYEPDDVARSVRRYLGFILPEGPAPAWTIRLERRQVADDERPVGVVLLGDAVTTQARESFDQGNVVDVYPVTIYLYPALGDDAQKARREGDLLRSLGHRLFKYGLALATDYPDACRAVDGRPKSGPFHLPLWDWDGIPAEGPADERVPPARAIDAMRIASRSLTAQNLGDDDDERRRTIVFEFRLELEMEGRVDDRAGGTVTGIEGAFAEKPS